MNDKNIKKIALLQMASSISVVIGSLVLAIGIFTVSMFLVYATTDGNEGYVTEMLDELTIKSTILIYSSIPIIVAGITIPAWKISKIKEEN
jgi:hypothetical protein